MSSSRRQHCVEMTERAQYPLRHQHHFQTIMLAVNQLNSQPGGDYLIWIEPPSSPTSELPV